MEFEKRAFEIRTSGDHKQIHALQGGMEGRTNIYPLTEKEANAYKTGLAVYFRRSGFNIPFDEIIQVENVALQRGFFDMFSAFETWYSYGKLDGKTADFEKQYQTALNTYMDAFRKNIIAESKYMFFIKGSLIALDVFQETVEKLIREGSTSYAGEIQCNSSKGTRRMKTALYLEEIRKRKEDLFDRMENPREYDPLLKDLNQEEKARLRFVKYLRGKKSDL